LNFRLSISHKLLLAFVGLTTVVLTATLILARWSFENGFLDYMNALEQQRLEWLAAKVADYYLEHGTLETLSEDELITLQVRAIPEDKDLPFKPPPWLKLLRDRTKERQSPPLDTGAGGTARLPHTALYLANDRFLLGDPSVVHQAELITVPVIANGSLIAELRCVPRRLFATPQETQFSRQQWITSLLIAAASLLLAFLASVILTRLFLAPIKQMMRGVAKLADGNYQHRINRPRADELGDLMEKLNWLAHSLQEGRTARKRWLADISHELRTPVTVLTGEIEALKDGIRPFDRQHLSSLDQEMTRLRRLIDDLYQLSVSDIGGLNYQLAPVDIQTLLGQVVETFAAQAHDKAFDISLASNSHEPIYLHADQHRIQQLFTNLVRNSLAYTDAPGQIKLSLQQQNGQARVRVEDTPPGVDSETCSRLFDPLYRVESSRNRRTAGAGLGLAICKNIVEAHQGSISASPSSLGGLSIEIRLPIYQER